MFNIFEMNLFLFWIKDVSVLVMLMLIYNFIPDRIFIVKKGSYSLVVGILFASAAILVTVIEWTSSSQFSVGINAILIPVAGFFGGLISAGIIAIVLILFSFFFENNGPYTQDIGYFVLLAGIGLIFYYIRERNIVRISPIWLLVPLSLITAIITIVVIFYPSLLLFITSGQLIQFPLFEIAFLITIGVIILGYVIININENKENKYELITYKEHLEALVQERTTDLEHINALHKATTESTTDGILVLDFDGFIQGFNTAAADILDLSADQMLENRLDLKGILHTKIKDFKKTDLKVLETDYIEQHFSINLTFISGNIYEVQVTPYRLKGKIIGSVINFRDITKRKQAEDALYMINQKLILLSGITRHDILNQLTALNLYHNLTIDEIGDHEIVEYVKKANQISHNIQLQIEFTRDYQEIGLNEPVWLILADSYKKAAYSFENTHVIFSFSGPDVEIFSDPLLERVFYNLIDNSLRHGDHVSSISLTTMPEKECLIIRYEDDGSGIEPKDKKKIFEKGFGKHTGMGMFLIHEILSITGITIEETGSFGVGARFDIKVPIGKFRVVYEKDKAI
jgi:PAS domain S-box-containing protein